MGTFCSMTFAHNGDCTIFYETFGDAADPALLMVNGLGSQCINYKTEWCELFAARGLYVIRFDNRDVGLSTHFTDAPVDVRGACYSLSDMASDAIAVLDDLDIEAAHHWPVDGRDDRPNHRNRASGPGPVVDFGDVEHG